jgi:hypothetical protein
MRAGKRRRGAAALEHVLLLGVAFPFAVGLVWLCLKALAVVERFMIDAMTSPLL